MPPEHLKMSLLGCISTTVDATFIFIRQLRLVMKAACMLLLMTLKQHGRPLFVPSESSHRDPNRAPTVVAPSTPVTPPEEETPFVPETPRSEPAQRDPSPNEAAIGVVTKIEAKDGMTPPLLSRLMHSRPLREYRHRCMPIHQMDHGVRGPACDHCKRALGPLPSQNQRQPTPTSFHVRHFRSTSTPGDRCQKI